MVITETLPSDLKAITKFIPTFMGKIKHLPLRDSEREDVRLCLEEALVNALKHGNRMNSNLAIEFEAEYDDSRLAIMVKDQGQGFDFQNLPNPTQEENILKISGRGIFLIKKLMDEVVFLQGGRAIKMVKLLKTRRLQ